jgi:hypothetical protein
MLGSILVEIGFDNGKWMEPTQDHVPWWDLV